jgi:hypothetical protein
MQCCFVARGRGNLLSSKVLKPDPLSASPRILRAARPASPDTCRHTFSVDPHAANIFLFLLYSNPTETAELVGAGGLDPPHVASVVLTQRGFLWPRPPPSVGGRCDCHGVSVH